MSSLIKSPYEVLIFRVWTCYFRVVPAGLKFNFGWLVKSFQDFQVLVSCDFMTLVRPRGTSDVGGSRSAEPTRGQCAISSSANETRIITGPWKTHRHDRHVWHVVLTLHNFTWLWHTLTHLSQLVLRLVCLAWNSSRCSPRQSWTSCGQSWPVQVTWHISLAPVQDYIDEVLPRQCRARVSIEAGRHHSWGSLIGIESWTERSPKLNGHLMWLGSPQEVGPPNCLWALDQPPWHVFTQPFQWNWTDSNQTNLHIDIALQPFSSEAWHGHLCHTQE